MSGFHGAFATGVASQQGTLTLPDTWFRPPILGLANAPIVETKFLELAMSLLDFSPRIPLGTFSILLPMKTDLNALSINTVLATKYPIGFNLTLLCIFLNSSKLCYINITFSTMCCTFKRRKVHIYRYIYLLWAIIEGKLL